MQNKMPMKHGPTMLFAGLLVAALGGCNRDLPANVAALGYVNRECRFAMNVPDGWTVRESRGTIVAVATAPVAAGEGTANVTVVVDPAPGLASLDELVRTNRGQTAAMRGFRLIAEEPRTLADGRQAQAVTFEQAAIGQVVRQRQLYVLAADRAYTVTATASPPEAFAGREADFETVLRSFRAGW